ncbi:MAG TPA: protease inhibitor I42 family protein [Methanoregula sp.]|nr:protease inhibitor I42 family protein [Methanoregula sp.]
MNFPFTFIGLGILCIAVLVVAGCAGTGSQNPGGSAPKPAETPVQVGHVVVNDRQNGATIYVNRSSDITLKLEENPTTGYSWNLTVTPGLIVTSDTYIPSDTSGKLVGSGGTHTWDIKAAATGKQAISAVYKRPWEQVTGNETAFVMTVIVE